VVLLVDERVFVVEYVFREGNRHTGLMKEQFAEKFPETPVNLLNKIKRVQACINAHGHHFQHLL
jgi:hypothetical protein